MRRMLLVIALGLLVVPPGAVRARDVSQPVVSGTVRDDAGEPVVGVEVVALRRVPGQRRLQAEGRDRTDDRGAYRLFLRSPSLEYLVRVHGDSGGRRGSRPEARAVIRFPTLYYPSAPRPSGATPVTVGLNEERRGVDFTLSVVRGVTVTGTIAGVERLSVTGIDLTLLPLDDTGVQWELPVATVRIPRDGRFSFSNVPPGAYVLWAVAFRHHADRPTPTAEDGSALFGVRMTITRGGGGIPGPPPPGDTQWIKERVLVDRDDLDLTIGFSRGAQLAGRMVFDGASAPPTPTDLERITVRILSVDGADLGPVPLSSVQSDGRFTVVGVPPGPYELELAFQSPIWQLRSVRMQGRTMTGRPLPIEAQDITDLEYTFTDRRTRVSGRLHTGMSRPLEGGSIAVFPTDRSLWATGVRAGLLAVGQSVEAGAFDVTVPGAGEYFVVGDPRVPSAFRELLHDPSVLDALSHTAMRVRLDDGQHLSVTVIAAVPR